MKLIKNSICSTVLTLAVLAGQTLPVVAPVALLGGVVVTQTACPSADISKVCGRVVRGFDSAIVIFRANGVAVESLVKGRDLASRARDYFASNDPANGLEYTHQLLVLFEDEILAQMDRIADQRLRTIAMVALILVRDQLGELADRLAGSAPVVQSRAESQLPRAVQTIRNFKAKKKWQCRNSITGQYANMDYCKSNPATSTVETR